MFLKENRLNSKHKLINPFFIYLFGVIVIIFFICLYIFRTLNAQNNTNNNSAISDKYKKLVVGIDATYPPMEFVDINGKLAGYDIDLGQKIAEKLGVSIEFRNIKWDDLFPKLKSGEIDLIISSVTITDERKSSYDFSDPYLNVGQVIITQKSNKDIKGTSDLSGKRIAIQKNTTNEQQAKLFTSPKFVLSFDNFIDATKSLLEGKADAVLSDLTNAKGITKENPTLKIASDPFTSEYYGIVLRKNDDDFRSSINSTLNSLRQQGYLIFLNQKWLE